MKLRHPLLTKTLALAGSLAVRGWMSTVPVRYHFPGPNVDPYRNDVPDRYIFAIWHEYLLLPVYRFGRANISTLISQHADGELIADICRHLRWSVVRGSTTRGGADALRKLIRHGRSSHIAITVDGPRGPRRHVQAGIVYLAARAGLGIVPAGIGYYRPWRLASWDRFALPRPWGFAGFVAGAPVRIPPDVGRRDIEAYRRLVEDRLAEATHLAEDWAATGKMYYLRSVPPLTAEIGRQNRVA